jgi:hypothetical protein
MIAAATETAVVNLAGTLPSAGDNYLYANETYHSVSVFAPVYLELGGAASLGFPITEMFIERRPDGKAYWVQYFEKAVIEYHPEETGANSYQLAPLGVWRFNEKYPQGAPPPKPLPGPEQYHFNETNHTVSDPFLTYWKERGQVRRFGYPISESFEEVSEADGKTYIVQYFERAVMEYHPELKPPHQVQLTALGTLRHRALYPNGAPMAASNPIPSPTVNATATARAIANATATAVQAQLNAQATAQALSRQATATAEARAASARATARAREYESYKTNPPTGTFRNSGSNVAIVCKIEYQQCVGYWCANKNSKYILVGVTVTNIGNDTVHVNPHNFTLVSTTGATVAHDMATYSLGNYLDAVDIEPGTYTSGWLAFLTTKDFIPGELVWREIFGEKVIVTIVEPPD